MSLLSKCRAKGGASVHMSMRKFGAHAKPIEIAIIGAGKMAEAAAGGLRTSTRFTRPLQLNVYDINADRCSIFSEKFGATAHSCAKTCVAGSDMVFLSCKPQNVKAVGAKVHGAISERTVVLSILAGTTLSTLRDCLGAQRIVRSMPNTPAAVNEGITVWAAENLTADDKALCSAVLSSFGQEIQVDDEQYLDMATALSGSGPAYVLLLIESMIETGVHFGFSREIATRLVHQTVKGTAIYAQTSELNSASLRSDITSPGGTTASALYSLERGGFR
jgi:pyrroline-5-carboxylate reductase